MEISVIVPVYNRSKTIEKCIESILMYLEVDDELIVSDNNSDDGTWDILISKYSEDIRVVLHRNQQNLGPAENWKVAFELSSKPLIKFLWSDDYFCGDFLTPARKILKFDNKIGLVLSSVKWSEKIGAREGYLYRHQGLNSAYEYYRGLFQMGSSPVSGSCAIFRREPISSVFSSSHDWSKFERNTGAGIDYLMFSKTFELYDYFFATNVCNVIFGINTDGITQVYNERLWFHYFNRMQLDSTVQKDQKLRRLLKTRIYFCSLTAKLDETKQQMDKLLLAFVEDRLMLAPLIKAIVRYKVYKHKSNIIQKFKSVSQWM